MKQYCRSPGSLAPAQARVSANTNTHGVSRSGSCCTRSQLKGPAEGGPGDAALRTNQPLTPTRTCRRTKTRRAYIPKKATRIAARGVGHDCGHNGLHAELHQIPSWTSATRRQSTVVHGLSNLTGSPSLGFGTVDSERKLHPKALRPAGVKKNDTSVTQRRSPDLTAASALPTGIERKQPSTTPFIVWPAHRQRKPRGYDVVTPQWGEHSVKALKSQQACAIASAEPWAVRRGNWQYTALQPPSRSVPSLFRGVNEEVAVGPA